MPPSLSTILIAGTSHVGKSTLAGLLSTMLGWQAISTDSLARHPGRPWPGIPAQVEEYYTALSAETIHWFLKVHHQNIWPLIRPMIDSSSHSGNPAIFEGAALRPEFISPLLGSTVAGGECLASYRASVPNGNREWLISGRVDYNFSDKDKIFGRVKFDRGSQPTYTDPINPVFNIQSNQPQNEGQLNYTHVFNPRVVNNFVGSVIYYSALFQSPDLNSALSTFPHILNITDANLTPLGSGSGSFPFFAIFCGKERG